MKAAAEKETKAVTGAIGTRNLLDEIDKKAAETPVDSSPQSPASMSTPASPAPYAGKFDPKAIAKKAALNSANVASKLGTDIMLPGAIKTSAPVASSTLKANIPTASGPSITGMPLGPFPYLPNGILTIV